MWNVKSTMLFIASLVAVILIEQILINQVNLIIT